MLCLPDGNVYKTILISVLNKLMNGKYPKQLLSPIADMYKAVQKYNMENLLIDWLNRGMIGSKEGIKQTIKNVVWQREKQRWKATTLLYQSLSLYNETVEDMRFHVWWCYADKFPHLLSRIACVVSVLMGQQPKGVQCNLKSTRCLLCGSREKEDAMHVLFYCASLTETRVRSMHCLYSKMPPALVREFEDSSKFEVLKLIVTCLKGSYVNEWDPVYGEMSKFVYDMYSCRRNMYNQLDGGAV